MAGSFCQKCGTPNIAGAQFCSKCGAPLVATPPPAAPPQAQQVWTAPVPPPPKKSRTVLIVAVVVVVLLVVVLLGLYAAGVFNTASSSGGGGGGNSQITITGFTFTPDYTGTTSGYLASSYTCGSSCPLQIPVGGSVTITLGLTSAASVFNHNIDDFTVTGGFSVTSVSPTLPVTLAPGGSQTFTLTVQAPSVSGSYSISGTIVTN